MGVVKFVFRLIGWLLTIALQITASFFIIFMFSVIFAGVDSTSRLGWLFLLFCIWLGYGVGINLVGYISLHWVWRTIKVLPVQRLVSTLIAALIPLLILVPIGYSVPVGDSGTRFYDLVTNNWQPILAQASLFTAILGYYIPSLLKQKESPSLASSESTK